jgi:hypothetical protein
VGALVVFLIFAGVFWAAPIFVAHKIGAGKNRPNGWVWGLLLGWLGVLIVALLSPGMPPQQHYPLASQPALPTPASATFPIGASNPAAATKTCPDCAEDIGNEDAVCRYCGHRFVERATARATDAPAQPAPSMTPVETRKRIVIEPD